MPKKKKYYIDVPKLIMYEALDLLMFSFVIGMKRGMPTVTLKRCVELFMDDYNLCEDNYPMDHARKAW